MRLDLILAAVVPALLLLLQVYRADRLEKEPASLLLSLVFWGIVATELAALTEQGGILLLERVFRPERSSVWRIGWTAAYGAQERSSTVHDLILYFGIVALSEEGIKYLFLRRRTWNCADFDCTFDGVVYAVFLSLGFALCENVRYALAYGMTTALARAVTAVPGHACFGVFMGTWYGLAKRASLRGQEERSRLLRLFAVLIPVLLHGIYDFVAASGVAGVSWLFLPFVAIMFLTSHLLVRIMSRRDRYMR